MAIPFCTIAENWLGSIEPTVSKNTYSIYAGYVKNYMIPYIEKKSVEEVNRHIDEYIEKIEACERAELVKKFYPVLSMILDYALEREYIGFNYSRVNAPFAKNEGISYSDVGIDELAAILAEARYEGVLPDLALMLDLGLSRGEILGLRWSDVDIEGRRITVNRMVVARNGATHITEVEPPRVLPIMSLTADILAECKPKFANNENFLVPSPLNEASPFNPSAYRKKIARVTGKALDGDSITIELIGYILSIITDRAATGGREERCAVLALALERSWDHSRVELKYRKAGTGYVSQLSPNCWQGRYTPTVNGKRISKNVYAPTREECERKLSEIITAMKGMIKC